MDSVDKNINNQSQQLFQFCNNQINQLKIQNFNNYSEGTDLLKEKDKQIEHLQEECYQLKKIIEQQKKQQYENNKPINIKDNIKGINTSTNFPTKNEIKKIWEDMALSSILDNFIDFENEPKLIYHLINEMIFSLEKLINNFCYKLYEKVSLSLNIPTNNKKFMCDIEKTARPLIKENLDKIFAYTENKDFIKEFNSSFINFYKNYLISNSNVNIKQFEEILNSDDFKMLIKKMKDIILFNIFNDPQLSFNIKENFSKRMPEFVNIKDNNDRKKFLIINDKNKLNIQGIIILKPPVLRSGFPLSSDFKSIVMICENETENLQRIQNNIKPKITNLTALNSGDKKMHQQLKPCKIQDIKKLFENSKNKVIKNLIKNNKFNTQRQIKKIDLTKNLNKHKSLKSNNDIMYQNKQIKINQKQLYNKKIGHNIQISNDLLFHNMNLTNMNNLNLNNNLSSEHFNNFSYSNNINTEQKDLIINRENCQEYFNTEDNISNTKIFELRDNINFKLNYNYDINKREFINTFSNQFQKTNYISNDDKRNTATDLNNNFHINSYQKMITKELSNKKLNKENYVTEVPCTLKKREYDPKTYKKNNTSDNIYAGKLNNKIKPNNKILINNNADNISDLNKLNSNITPTSTIFKNNNINNIDVKQVSVIKYKEYFKNQKKSNLNINNPSKIVYINESPNTLFNTGFKQKTANINYFKLLQSNQLFRERRSNPPFNNNKINEKLKKNIDQIIDDKYKKYIESDFTHSTNNYKLNCHNLSDNLSNYNILNFKINEKNKNSNPLKKNNTNNIILNSENQYNKYFSKNNTYILSDYSNNSKIFDKYDKQNKIINNKELSSTTFQKIKKHRGCPSYQFKKEKIEKNNDDNNKFKNENFETQGNNFIPFSYVKLVYKIGGIKRPSSGGIKSSNKNKKILYQTFSCKDRVSTTNNI